MIQKTQLTDSYTLHNGYKIPCVGFGTWRSKDDTAFASVTAALSDGYRHIDTATCYWNETPVGQAIAQSGIPRADIFVTSKVWNPDRGYKSTIAAFEASMEKLALDYLDLYLIHWPAAAHRFDNWEEINLDTWKAITELYQAGRIKSIGVSNFLPHHLDALMKTEVAPMVNQIEFHPGMMQKEAVAFCRENDILVEAWSPLGGGAVLSDGRLATIAEKYGKSVAQLCVRWCLQHDVLPLPKSATPSRIKENADVFDFIISEEDMAFIDGLPALGCSGLHPDKNNF